MRYSPASRRTTTPSRAALAVASLAAGATFAVSVAIAGPWSAPIADAAVAFEPVPVVVDTSTGERVVVDTVYVTAPDPAALVAPASGEGEREHGDDEHEGTDD
jgi:hypothetical protein